MVNRKKSGFRTMYILNSLYIERKKKENIFLFYCKII